MKNIIIASPHARNNIIAERLSARLDGYNIIRISRCDELVASNLQMINPEWIFFPHWSWLIPADIYEKFECVIFHMTDLPYGRGGSPLQNLIIHGHVDTQLSALKCVKELDAGPIFEKRKLSLEGTAEQILNRASSIIEEMIFFIVKHKPTPIEQTGDVVQFVRRKREEGNLALLSDIDKVYDYIRMLDADGYPNAFVETENLHFEFNGAEKHTDWIDAKVRIRVRIND